MVCVYTDNGNHWKSKLICSCTFYVYLYVLSLNIVSMSDYSPQDMRKTSLYFLNVDCFLSLKILVKSLSIHVGTNYQSFLILEGGTEPSKE